MARHVRAPTSSASDPAPGMRVYGRTPAGRLAVVVVHWVENGSVYCARRIRGEPLKGFVRWPLFRRSLADWGRSVRAADVVGVKVPAGRGQEVTP